MGPVKTDRITSARQPRRHRLPAWLLLVAGTAIPALAQPAPTLNIVEFVDYGSASSRQVHALLTRVLPEYEGTGIVVRHAPADPKSRLAHRFALLAEQRGKFEAVHAKLLANDPEFTLTSATALAKASGIDTATLKTRLEDAALNRQLDRDIAEREALGIGPAPALIIKGRVLSGIIDEAGLRRTLDTALGRTLLSKSVPLNLANAPRLGPAAGPEITVFSDFQCPYCAVLAPVLKQLADSGDAVVRFKHYPLSFHTKSPLAHRAAIAAGEQGKFWEMHDRIFAAQNQLDRETFLKYATALGLDIPRFEAALSADKAPAALTEDMAEGDALPVQGTPTVLINGRQYMGANSLEALRSALRLAGGQPSSQPESPVSVQAAPVSSGIRLYGSPDAPIKLEWFFDAQSELTVAAGRDVRALIESSPANVQVIARHLPLAFHPESPLVHEALSIAASEGKFWEFLQILHRSPETADAERLKSIGSRLGLDLPAFIRQLETHARKAEVDQDLALARTRDIRGVPTFSINGSHGSGTVPTRQQLAEEQNPASAKPAAGGAGQ